MEPRTASQFAPGVIDASRAVLVEIGVILRSYLKDLALIGGWAPYFLLQQHQQAGFDHVGSIDIRPVAQLLMTTPSPRPSALTPARAPAGS